MRKLIWKTLCAYRFWSRADVRPSIAWDMAKTCYEMWGGDDGPFDAADEDMTCWGD